MAPISNYALHLAACRNSPTKAYMRWGILSGRSGQRNQLCIDTAGRTERPSLLHNTVSWLNSFASVLSADGYSHSHRSISVRCGARTTASWSATCFSTRPGRNGWLCKTQMEIWKRFSRERLRDTPVQVRSIPKGRVRQGKVPKLREAAGPSGESQ